MNKLTKLIHILRTPLFIRGLLKNVAAGVEHEELLRTLTCSCVVDIGANRGQFSLISRKVFPQAMIYAFEPLTEPANKFRQVFKNDTRVKLSQCAIGPENGQTTIHVSKQDDSSSLLPISERQAELFPGTDEKEIRQVEVSLLENVLKREDILHPGFLKIDVQGYEKSVLRGCDSLITCFSYIYVECSFVELYQGQALAHEIIDYLRQRNFYLSGVYNVFQSNTGQAIQGDFLFRQNTSIEK